MKHQKLQRRIAAKGGSYALAVTAVVLAILIAVNILASVLPTALTKLDISSTKLYSITSSTKVVVNNLEKDVTIYWVVQSDKEDEVIENLLGKIRKPVLAHYRDQKESGRLSDIHRTIYRRRCTEQQPYRRVRREKPVYFLQRHLSDRCGLYDIFLCLLL